MLTPQPVPPLVADDKPQRLNSLLPRVTQETLKKVFAEINEQDDPQQIEATTNSWEDLVIRENYTMFRAVANAQVVAAVVLVYRLLAAQADEDARLPA